MESLIHASVWQRRKIMSIDQKSGESFEFLPDDFLLAENQNLGMDQVYPARSYWSDVFSAFIKNKGAVIGLIAILFIIFFAIAGPYMNGYTYDGQIIANQNLAPRIPGLETWGIFDGTEHMSTSTGVNVVNKYVISGKTTGLENTYYWFSPGPLWVPGYPYTSLWWQSSLIFALE